MTGNGDDGPRGIDPMLRKRVMDEITIVTDALDAAAADPADGALDELHEALDKLMRALGRVLIEIERQRKQPQSHR